MKKIIHQLQSTLERHPRLKKAQSFVELALILPIILMILLGVVELSFLVSQYPDLLDLTREAARFASVRDPLGVTQEDFDCSTIDKFNFYFDTSCIFSPPSGSANCTDSKYCNGLNAFIVMNPVTDDVVVSAYTVEDVGGIYGAKTAYPEPDGYWALSDHDSDTVNNGNWKEDCEGNVVKTQPYYTLTSVTERLNSDINTPHNKGFVAVELYYCYHQVLQLPFFTSIVPDPLRLHAYTFMSLPAVAPTPTEIPSPSTP